MHPSSAELCVVMPAFNEEASVEHVVREWFAELDPLGIDFIFLAIDDGSTDTTLDILRQLCPELGKRLEIISQKNHGHGQSCIRGYRIALERGIPFVLQVDSDGQSAPSHFAEFWKRRQDFDVIYGKRSRSDGLRRVLASYVLRQSLRWLAGADCIDANVPYRLMNSVVCAEAIRRVPEQIFLANVGLAVILAKSPEIRHGEVAIGFPPRLGGEPSVPFGKFAAKGFELFVQLKKAGIA